MKEDLIFDSSSYGEYVVKCAAENTEPADEPIWKIVRAFHDRLLGRPNDPIPEYCVPDPAYTGQAVENAASGFVRTEWKFGPSPALDVYMPYDCRPGIPYTDNLVPGENPGLAAGAGK